MPTPVILTQSDAIPLAVVRRRAARAELPKLITQSCGVVWQFVRAHGIRGGRHVAVYLNGAIDVEVGVEVPGPFDAEGDVVPSSTPSGLTASTVHFGPYQGLSVAHQAVLSWCEANGHRLVGPSWEIYGHWQPDWDTDPSRIRTDIFYRVAPIS